MPSVMRTARGVRITATHPRPATDWARIGYLIASADPTSDRGPRSGMLWGDIAALLPANGRRTVNLATDVATDLAEAIELYGYRHFGYPARRGLDPFGPGFHALAEHERWYTADASHLRYCASTPPDSNWHHTLGLYAGEQSWAPPRARRIHARPGISVVLP